MTISLTLLRHFSCLVPLFLTAAMAFSQTTTSSGHVPPVSSSRPDLFHFSQHSTVKFIENRGQIVDSDQKLRPEILYQASRGQATLFFMKNRISYVFVHIPEGYANYLEGKHHDDDEEHQHGSHAGTKGHDNEDHPVLKRHRVDMDFIGSNPDVKVIAEDITESYTNYYLAHCRLTGVPSYRKLTYQNLYPNIDMVMYASDSGSKCDFIVHPGGRVSDIRMRYTAADDIRLLKDGSLKMSTSLGYLHESAPYSYQNTGANAAQRTVASRFVLANGVVTFNVGTYDRTRTLVIDPKQLWATFFGGNGNDQLNGGDPTEVDREGNVMITGVTTSTDYPANSGYQTSYRGSNDAFVTKFTGKGRHQWSSYFGGTMDELSHGVSTDKHGNVFIAGHTHSNSTTNNFPLVGGLLQGSYAGGRDAFIAKFTPSGSLLWSTYYGGAGFDDGYGFAVDSTDSVAVLITSESDNLHYQNPDPRFPAPHRSIRQGRDALIVKVGKDGHKVWATYLGGSGTDWGYAAASDLNDNIIVTGWTNSSHTSFLMVNPAQPTNGGGYDAYVAKFDRYGAVRWCTFWGGTGNQNDGGTWASSTGFSAVTTDIDGNVCIAGATNSGFPTRNALYPNYNGGAGDAYIAKFSPDGQNLWSTYVGGGATDIGVGVASNSVGGVLLTGYSGGVVPISTSPRDPPLQTTNRGGNDAFIVKLNGAGTELQWGSMFGGSGDDQGHGISFDPYGSIVVGGLTTSTEAVPFTKARIPSELPEQGTKKSGIDAWVSVFCDAEPPEIDSSGPTTFCHDQDLTLSIIEGYFNVRWYKRDGSNKVQISTDLSIRITESGEYFVEAENVGGCPSNSDTIKVTKLERLNPVIPAEPNTICTGDSLNLVVTGGPYHRYTWYRNQIEIPGEISGTLKVKQGGNYKVVVANIWGCRDSTERTVTEHPLPQPISITPADTIEICEDDPGALLRAIGGNGGVIQWSNGMTGPSITPNTQGLYFAKSVNPATGCSTVSNKTYVKVNPKPPIAISPLLPLEFCEGDSTVLIASRSEYASYEWSTGERTQRIVVRQSGLISLSVIDNKGCRNRAQVMVTMYERPRPRILPRGGPITRCDGDTVLLSVDGGVFNTVVWSTGALGVPARITKSGEYYALVTGPGGCRAYSDTIRVTFIPKPDAQISGAQAVCTNSSGSYSVPSQNGVTYLWEATGAGASVASGTNTNSITVNWGPTGTGTVTVTVTHTATGCKSTATMNVEVGSVLVPAIAVRPGPAICPGDSAELDAGPGYASYRWSNGATARSIIVKDAGSYTVTVENAGGCKGTSQPVQITISQLPVPVIVASGPTTLCPGDTIYLSVSAPFRDYLWSGGQTIDRIPVWESGTFTVTVVDANGCRGTSAPVEVRVATPPAPVISGPNSVCINSTETYSVPNVPGDTYQWEVTGGQPSGTGSTNSISVLWPTAGPGLVKVIQRSGATGCVDSTQYDVTVGTSLHPSITASGPTLICQGDSITLFAPDGYATYLWTNGSTDKSIIVDAPGTYSVTVTNTTGCSGSGGITITQKAPLAPKIVPDGRPGLCPGDSLRLEATAGFHGYLWSTGETTQSIWVKQAGSYSVTVFDADSCSDISAVVNVIMYPQLSTPVIEPLGDSLVATVNTIDAPTPAGYQWRVDGQLIVGATEPKVYVSTIGTYTVTVVDSNGCTAESGPFTPLAATSATIVLPVIEAAPGEPVKIPIKMTTSVNLDRSRVERFSGELRFDRSLLILTDPRFTSMIDGDQQVVKIEGSRPELMTAGDLLTIDFMAALGNKLTTPLELRSFLWLDGLSGATAVTLEPGRFNLLDICETGGHRLLDASGNVGIKVARPNPISTVAEIEYEVNEHGRTQLFIVDLLGRQVATLVDGNIQPGGYLVQLDASQLASGTYFCVLQTPTLRMHYPLQVEK